MRSLTPLCFIICRECVMLVSCLMPTYKRMPKAKAVVEESLQSFIQQDWPEKELIIVNDCPGQTLVYNHPHVRVVNLPYRAHSLGEKLNIVASTPEQVKAQQEALPPAKVAVTVPATPSVGKVIDVPSTPDTSVKKIPFKTGGGDK